MLPIRTYGKANFAHLNMTNLGHKNYNYFLFNTSSTDNAPISVMTRLKWQIDTIIHRQPHPT